MCGHSEMHAGHLFCGNKFVIFVRTHPFTEADYSYQLQKNVIPLKMESKYEPDGWLGAMLGNKLYFDCTQPDSFDDSLNRFVKELGNRGKA